METTVTSLSSLIGTLGFPIVMCGVLFWYMMKQEERHKEEVDSLRKSLDNNTKVLTKIYERLGGADDGKKG